ADRPPRTWGRSRAAAGRATGPWHVAPGSPLGCPTSRVGDPIVKKLVTLTTAALAIAGGATMASLASGSSQQSTAGTVVSASPTHSMAPSAAAQGWQGDFVYAVP